MPLLIGNLTAAHADVRDDERAIKSLDEINSQSSDIPALLLGTSKDLPAPVINTTPASGHSTVEPAKKVSSQIAKQQTQIAELSKKLADEQKRKTKEIAALKKTLAQTQHQLEILQANAQVPAEQQTGSAVNSGDSQALVESQNQIIKLKNQIAELTAAQTASAKALTEAKASDSATVMQLKKSLTDSQNRSTELTKQVTELTAAQTASAKALTEAKGKASDTVAALKKALSESQNRSTELTKQVTELTTAQTASATALAEAQTEGKSAAIKLKKYTEESNSQLDALMRKNADLAAAQEANAKSMAEVGAANDRVVAELKKSLVESRNQRDELDKKWQESTAKITEQEKQIAGLKVEKSLAVASITPQTKADIRAYALGTLWGQEVASAIHKITAEGDKLELRQVIGGVSDAINNSIQLPKDIIVAELDNLDKEVKARNTTSASAANDKGQKYIRAFSKKAGVKRASMGYYYRIKEKGKGKINKTDLVSVQLKESLSSGKVIKDMAKGGKTITLPLKDFPPLFSSAIGQMNRQGKLEMVVPPDLAYGDAGRLPEIPPSSTMVYEINVVDVKSQ